MAVTFVRSPKAERFLLSEVKTVSAFLFLLTRLLFSATALDGFAVALGFAAALILVTI